MKSHCYSGHRARPHLESRVHWAEAATGVSTSTQPGRPWTADIPASASAGKGWRWEGLSRHLLGATVSLNPTNTCHVQDEESEVQEDALQAYSAESPLQAPIGQVGLIHGNPLLPGLPPPPDRNPLEGRG